MDYERTRHKDPESWSDLPSLVLEKICRFLSRRDQMNMLLVFPNWSHLYESPSLWKRFRFIMNESNMKNNACSLMNCVQKYSRYFKHVHISLERYMKKEQLHFWRRYFKTFLQILTKTSQVVSLKFVYLGQFFTVFDELDYHSTCNSICKELDRFLGSQRNLKRLEFCSSYFKDKDGVQLLKTCVENSNNSLNILKLRDYFQWEEEEQNLTTDQLLPSILSIPNLSHLEIDYWLIFGKEQANLFDVFEKLEHCRKETYLKILTGIYNLVDCDFEFLTSSDWRHLKLQYPKLEVELNIDKGSAPLFPLQDLILEHMPISVLSYNLGYPELELSIEIEIDEFLSHIIACKISNTLDSLSLEWSKPIRDVAMVFIPFLKVCKKLKKLVLNVVYPSNHLEDLLESLLNDKPPSLEEFKLTILDVEDEQVEPLQNLGSEFERRLKAVNLNLKLLVKEIEQESEDEEEDQKDKEED